jgi:hypothetical protein
MRVAAEGPNPVQVALNKLKKPRPAVAEVLKKEAQLARKNKRNNSSNSKTRMKPRKKPRKFWKKKANLLRSQPEKAVEAAKNNHAGCMTQNYLL